MKKLSICVAMLLSLFLQGKAQEKKIFDETDAQKEARLA